MTDRFRDTIAPTSQNRVRRVADRGRYDLTTICEILDAGLVAHVSFIDAGRPVVMPMAYGRSDSALFLHSARKGRFATALAGNHISVCVTLVDGLVVARSMFESSMNYRSAIIHGTASELTSEDERLSALRAIGEHNMPGRWDEVRAPFEKELKATSIFAVDFTSASAKIRTGPPIDDYDERDMTVWTGIVPVTTIIGEPVTDATVPAGVPVPTSLSRIRKG